MISTSSEAASPRAGARLTPSASIPRRDHRRRPADEHARPRRRAPRRPSGDPRVARCSPKTPTVSPATRPSRSRIVKASSSAWVGCSCAPSPALITEQGQAGGQQVRRAGAAVAQHRCRAHRLELRACRAGLALAHAAAGGGDVHRVGREALLGDLEGDAGAGAGLEEEVDQPSCRAAPDLLDLAGGDLLHRGCGVEDLEISPAARPSIRAGPCAPRPSPGAPRPAR